jgi:hypothetical protein
VLISSGTAIQRIASGSGGRRRGRDRGGAVCWCSGGGSERWRGGIPQLQRVGEARFERVQL